MVQRQGNFYFVQKFASSVVLNGTRTDDPRQWLFSVFFITKMVGRKITAQLEWYNGMTVKDMLEKRKIIAMLPKQWLIERLLTVSNEPCVWEWRTWLKMRSACIAWPAHPLHLLNSTFTKISKSYHPFTIFNTSISFPRLINNIFH